MKPILVLAGLAPLVLTLAACSSSTDASEDATEGRVSANADTCQTGDSFLAPQFRITDYSYFVAPAATVPIAFERANKRLGLGQPVEHAFAVAIQGGPNTLSVSYEDFSVCGETFMISSNAHLELWGDQCVGNGQPVAACDVVKQYCVPGTLDETREHPRCELKAGVTLEARIFPKEERCDQGWGFSLWHEPSSAPLNHSEQKAHSLDGYTLNANLALDSSTQQVQIRAGMQGALLASSWEACGSTVTVAPHARIESDPEGYIAEQYCNPGTFQSSPADDAPPNCELKAGIAVVVEVFARAAK